MFWKRSIIAIVFFGIADFIVGCLYRCSVLLLSEFQLNELYHQIIIVEANILIVMFIEWLTAGDRILTRPECSSNAFHWRDACLLILKSKLIKFSRVSVLIPTYSLLVRARLFRLLSVQSVALRHSGLSLLETSMYVSLIRQCNDMTTIMISREVNLIVPCCITNKSKISSIQTSSIGKIDRTSGETTYWTAF